MTELTKRGKLANAKVSFEDSINKLGKIIFPKPRILPNQPPPLVSIVCESKDQSVEQSPPLPFVPTPDHNTICDNDTSLTSNAPLIAENLPNLGKRYTVLSKLGQGGSASVYKVQDEELDKTFAVKVMRAELLCDSHAQLRFKQEADAASSLTHPNLVAVYSSGTTDENSPYLVMDCLSGKTLAQTLKESGTLDTERTVDILEQCVEALLHMHLKGVVHRDIKPSNIFLTEAENGTDLVKIVDFGIAKIQALQDSTHLTQTGDVFGSPLYMSPEQCRGESLDIRSDVYSLGCVAYEMLTGISPFAASNPIKIFIKHLSGSILPLSEVTTRSKIPEALQSVVMRCLEVEPKRRYQTVDELRRDLETIKASGKLPVVISNIFPSLYRRLAASVLDGIILSTLILASTSLVAIYFHLPCHLKLWSILICKDPFALLVFWSLVTAICGPALTVVILLLVTCVTFADSAAVQMELLISLLLMFFYFPIFESSRLGATPGKKILGLTVVNSQGYRLSFLHATARYLSKVFLLPSLSLENSIRVVRKMGEPLHLRFLRYGKELAMILPNPPKPPTDDFTGSYVINSNAFKNPYLPNLQEYLADEVQSVKDLNELNEKLKITKGAVNYNILFSLFIITWLLIDFSLANYQPNALLWSFWAAFLVFWGFPAVIYYRRFKLRKQQLLKERNKRKTLTPG